MGVVSHLLLANKLSGKEVKKQRKIVSEILLDKIRREGSFVSGFK